MKQKSIKWFASLSVLILISSFIISLVLVWKVILSRNEISKDNYHKNIAKEMSYLWTKDAVNYFLTGDNKLDFYNSNNKSPCILNSSIKNITSWDSNTFNINKLLNNNSSIFWYNDTIIENQWFINRTCSIFSKWLPHKLNSISSLKWDISSEDILYKWKTDENWFYNVWVIYDNENLWYFFTKEMLWKSEITINLDYNFEKLFWIDYFNIYETSNFLKNKINLIKKEENIPLTKTNIYNILWNHLSIQEWNLEIWVIEFDWGFNNNWFQISPNTWKVIESSIIIDWINNWKKTERLICSYTNKNCQLKDIKLNGNKIYFFYLKSFDKSVSYHIDFLDDFWNSIDIPTDKLFINLFWYSDWKLFKNSDYYDLSDLWWYFTSFDSSIYNYVFFNFN